jgi:predicted amidophosphoribosyltransferase
MRCSHCQRENDEGAKFCEECGTRLVQVCPGCGQEVKLMAKFCSTCGTALTGTGANTEGEKGKWIKGEREVVSDQLSVVNPQHPTPNP